MENVTGEFLKAGEVLPDDLGQDAIKELSNGRDSDGQENGYPGDNQQGVFKRLMSRAASKYTDSPLVNYTCISPNCNSPRTHSIDTVTIHMVWGQCSVETLGDIFKPVSRQASSNYGIGYDGRIGMYCHERDRSWCSSSPANDHRAITIETASDRVYPYTVTDAAYKALINLCVDICKRNGKKKMVWCGSLAATERRTFASTEMRMTLHKWFAATECPGQYLESRMGDIAAKVNAELAKLESPFKDVPLTHKLYGHIRACYDAGLVKGYSDRTFRPEGQITRADMCVMACRLLQKKGVKLTMEGKTPFTDIENHPLKDHITAAYNAGIVKGYDDGTFRPDQAMTRAEACVLFNRLMKKAKIK